ncbi:hypothetical protein A2533_01215 [Candidatus Falkowbacteria bacterium RIFOXYD2_FULL_35_9]|uniref:Uncharacterized protein n=1 Tax=Candidatus Falkowbacteria bacterium RIFOXYC2_FULL_36_12 TaxID=1798002 RepID=A0A1F5T300_9BACT|nr:MAG: hypothetical protein A2300_02215 [Candidatus Falkowbacteria bacterium RIFOXYB2_FULL_35_7]OGF33318.1 MAG: hypothetical protein A2478_01290 [Candidatus Falkowbacteria bacterium RIFOXYC2_FULL_36_12]OGF34868.1 MAG: hypothetical protein A2223_00425 [Candidatus Falkowbacteria bacterium RIFOXYA2_FULL_35_8]OGF46738.1 MAG: hypothetical protein A2533_01215 [Candidatus Falkowbacteria bacterium RIFOXYD2_FULL_35_9]
MGKAKKNFSLIQHRTDEQIKKLQEEVKQARQEAKDQDADILTLEELERKLLLNDKETEKK